MPRFLVERTWSEALSIPLTEAGSTICRNMVEINAISGVTWVNSYLDSTRTKMFCIYDSPNAEAVRMSAIDNAMPLDRITEVSVLSPYFYAP